MSHGELLADLVFELPFGVPEGLALIRSRIILGLAGWYSVGVHSRISDRGYMWLYRVYGLCR